MGHQARLDVADDLIEKLMRELSFHDFVKLPLNVDFGLHDDGPPGVRRMHIVYPLIAKRNRLAPGVTPGTDGAL
jgi:hypothetical protein